MAAVLYAAVLYVPRGVEMVHELDPLDMPKTPYRASEGSQ